jgi:hypothetical protein
MNQSRARQLRKEVYNGRPKNDRRYAVEVGEGKAAKLLHFFFPAESAFLSRKGQMICTGLRAKYKKLKKTKKFIDIIKNDFYIL